jgi:hypothetical protein
MQVVGGGLLALALRFDGATGQYVVPPLDTTWANFNGSGFQFSAHQPSTGSSLVAAGA